MDQRNFFELTKLSLIQKNSFFDRICFLSVQLPKIKIEFQKIQLLFSEFKKLFLNFQFESVEIISKRFDSSELLAHFSQIQI